MDRTTITCTADTPRPLRVRVLRNLNAVWITAPAAGDEPRVAIRLSFEDARTLRAALDTTNNFADARLLDIGTASDAATLDRKDA